MVKELEMDVRWGKRVGRIGERNDPNNVCTCE
jgi:hypothetical protein